MSFAFGRPSTASAMIHTLRFGNAFREGANGTAFLSFTNMRLSLGALVAVPMIHKTETGKRSHFLTATIQIADAPAPDELLIAIAASDGGRVHASIGDRFKDMAAMETEATLLR